MFIALYSLEKFLVHLWDQGVKSGSPETKKGSRSQGSRSTGIALIKSGFRSKNIDFNMYRVGSNSTCVIWHCSYGQSLPTRWFPSSRRPDPNILRGSFSRIFLYTIVPSRCRARICKRIRSSGIDSEESIPVAYVAWRAGITNMVVVPARQAGNRFLGSLQDLQIRAQAT